jgi:adenylate kinase family enzyme
VVVLLGPPGSGKSTVGAALGRLGLRWREWEATILERWGSRADFVAQKPIALPWLHEEIICWIDSAEVLAAIETTGLSDAPLLDRLDSRCSAFVVRLDVTEAVAMSRVEERPRKQHLTDDIESSRAIWRAFYKVVAPSRRVDVSIDTEVMSPEQIAQHITEWAGT